MYHMEFSPRQTEQAEVSCIHKCGMMCTFLLVDQKSDRCLENWTLYVKCYLWGNHILHCQNDQT